MRTATPGATAASAAPACPARWAWVRLLRPRARRPSSRSRGAGVKDSLGRGARGPCPAGVPYCPRGGQAPRHRRSAAGHRRQDGDLVGVLDLGVQAVQEADVLAVDVDVDEPPQAAVL